MTTLKPTPVMNPRRVVTCARPASSRLVFDPLRSIASRPLRAGRRIPAYGPLNEALRGFAVPRVSEPTLTAASRTRWLSGQTSVEKAGNPNELLMAVYGTSMGESIGAVRALAAHIPQMPAYNAVDGSHPPASQCRLLANKRSSGHASGTSVYPSTGDILD